MKQSLVVSPACFHLFIKGLLDLIWTRQDALQLITHLCGHVKVQEVTRRSLSQKYPGIAAGARTHCWEIEGKNMGIGFITI